MTLAKRQQAFIARFAVIDDSHERLAALIAHKPPLVPLAEIERTDAHLVRGCVSRVWLACSFENGRCRFRMDAESPMVKGLVGVLCTIYENATPEEIVATEPEVFDALGITKNLTPTRLNGLASVRRMVRDFARTHLG